MEGFGLPGLEAMSYGAPVASSNATSLPEIYKDGAHYFDPFSVESMTTAINDIITDPSLRKKIITNGKKVHASYSWERMAKQTLDIYNNALK
jgi:glycosyltransferase involved in cell wall biosynthesis